VYDVARKLGITSVPVVGEGSLVDAVSMVANGYKSVVAVADVPAEGLVMRPPVDLYDRRGKRIIAKIKYRDFPR
jgi:hypothetical protein